MVSMALTILSLASTAALFQPLARGPPLRPSLTMTPRGHGAATVHLLADEDADSTRAWPEPSFNLTEFRESEAKAKEVAEAEAIASPRPFQLEGGGFSVVALATVLVFVGAGSFFFQGISGGGAARLAGDQPPEVQTCINKAATRSEASACLPPVPLT